MPEFISKYKGLNNIHTYGLPHPDWIFIQNINELPSEPWAPAKYGWTIRICPIDSYKFGLKSKHHIPFNKIPFEVNLFEIGNLTGFFFVIYPSWRFSISGGCHVSPFRLIIEVVIGNIAPLLKGEVNPDAVMTFEGPYYSKLLKKNDPQNIFSKDDQFIILNSIRKIPAPKDVTLEWSKTTDRKILFHDWVQLIA